MNDHNKLVYLQTILQDNYSDAYFLFSEINQVVKITLTTASSTPLVIINDTFENLKCALDFLYTIKGASEGCSMQYITVPKNKETKKFMGFLRLDEQNL